MIITAFEPRSIGLAQMWACQECGSLVSSEEKDLNAHVAWHDWVQRQAECP